MALDPEITLSGESLEAWRDFARSLREVRGSPRTIQSYGEAVAQLQRWLNDHEDRRPVLLADRRDISGYLETCPSATTARNRHSALRSFYKFCAAEDICEVSPMVKVRAPAAEYNVPEVVSDERLRALLAACAGRDFASLRDSAIIRIWCEPGSPRCSEMAGLELADVDMAEDSVTIRYGKNRRTRVIAMSPATARAVSRYRRARAAHPRAAESDAMWLGPKGGLNRSGLGQMLARRAEAAGIGHVHPHQLRHTAFADFDKATGGHTNAEMALFGWSNPAMCHHYGRSLREASALATARDLNRGNRLAAR